MQLQVMRLRVQYRHCGYRLCAQPAAYSKAITLIPKLAFDQTGDHRAITALHPLMYMSIYLVIFSRKLSSATFRCNNQFVETKDIQKGTCGNNPHMPVSMEFAKTSTQ